MTLLGQLRHSGEGKDLTAVGKEWAPELEMGNRQLFKNSFAERGNRRRQGSGVKRGVFVVFKMGEISRDLYVGGNDTVEGENW